MQAADIVERNVVMLASGVEATWWWNLRSRGNDPIFGRMRLMTEDYQQLPCYDVYKRMVATLGAATAAIRIDTGDASIYLYRIDRSDTETPVYVAWRQVGDADPYDAVLAPAVDVTLPVEFSGLQVFDAQGNQADHTDSLRLKLGGMPVYILPD